MKRTPLYDIHKAMGAKFFQFAGWEMPLQYCGIIKEHNTVRCSVGLFDVSHMGRIEIEGSDAMKNVQYLITSDCSRITSGQVQYTVLCYPQGGIVDDLTVYKFHDGRIMFCVNAVNTSKDLQWIEQNLTGDVRVKDRSHEICQLALQGPLAQETLHKLTNEDLAEIKPFRFAKKRIGGQEVLISRTGYTGEDGFELFFPRDFSEKIWNDILEAGKAHDIKPIGLGARDTLRMEMKYPLYGNELTQDITPLEAGLEWLVKFDKPSFIGKETLLEQKRRGVRRRLVGFKMMEQGIARSQHRIFAGDEEIGVVTSGTFSPTLGEAIGIAMVKVEYSAVGSELEIEIRSRRHKAKVVPTPFYRRRGDEIS